MRLEPQRSRDQRLSCFRSRVRTPRRDSPDHNDMGSVLTMSVLLADPKDFDGGVFVTFEDGQAAHHDSLARGDALVIPSEMLHNVTTVTRGVRNSLVIELWEGKENRNDRYS